MFAWCSMFHVFSGCFGYRLCIFKESGLPKLGFEEPPKTGSMIVYAEVSTCCNQRRASSSVRILDICTFSGPIVEEMTVQLNPLPGTWF